MAKTEISFRELVLQVQQNVHYLLSKWKWIVLCGVVGLAGGLCYAIFSRPDYSATVTFVVDGGNDNTAMGAYAGIAAQFGIDLASGGAGNNLFSGSNIYELMKTRRLLENTLLTPVSIDGKKTLLVDRYIRIKKLKKKWSDDPLLKDVSFNKDTSTYTLANNKAISIICKLLVKENLIFPANSDNSGSAALMSATVVSKDEQFSALFATNLMENVGKYYVSTITRTARATLSVLNHQLDSIREQLYGAMNHVASFSDKNINLVRQGPQVEQQKSSLKMQVNAAMYQQLISAVETAKMNLQKETPLFEIVDRPILPLDRKSPNRILWLTIGLFCGLLLSIIYLLLLRIYQLAMDES